MTASLTTMGYDAHITRAKSWAHNARHRISAEEWLAYVAQHPELSLSPAHGPYFARWSGKSEQEDPWLDWSEGNIYSKNPDAALLDKMIAVARALHAQVQGDDGEVYLSADQPPAYPKPSLFDHLRHLLRAALPKPRIRETVPGFKVGDRVQNVFHREATVVELDHKAEHGLGKVKVRYDNGTEQTLMLAACCLTPVSNEEVSAPSEEPRH